MNDELNILSYSLPNDISLLRKTAINCQKCDLCKTRTQVVFDNNVKRADLMIVGEAPGASEDEQGLPFVGRAGQLLNLMLKSVGIDRDSVYITNVVKCRPPENRNPLPFEINSCMNYLKQQIEIIKPKIILGLGKFSGLTLLNSNASLKSLRQKVHATAVGNVLVTYHPAYLMRNPIEKAESYEDLLMLKKVLNEY